MIRSGLPGPPGRSAAKRRATGTQPLLRVIPACRYFINRSGIGVFRSAYRPGAVIRGVGASKGSEPAEFTRIAGDMKTVTGLFIL